MFIYAVRWIKRIDGEEECGNFEVCYTDEDKARKAMLADMENTKKDWEKDETVFTNFGDGSGDYCGIYIGHGTYDYHDWYVDKLEVM